MIRFKKLRLSGFKSFVEGTELDINLGLTGIVGPNGCGKSNLVEALRWVMGETSAKQMRGGEMDDVIFGGTANRPARNQAEVLLTLDNSDRSAPAQFNDFDELDISRRIEREKGSTYRVNGHEVRAKDVQLLFADSATGARSTAMVSQGKISAVIAAKPTERRRILEEAAGITGLHSRRHEAELRLRGADTNLERLDDILVTLDAQLANLKKQARQATRYRNLSEHIRKAEATLFFLRWTASEETLEAANKEFQEMETMVASLTGTSGKAAAIQAEHAAQLPKRRHAEAEAAAEFQRLNHARESLDAEEQRIQEAATDCAIRIEQAATDKTRETALIADAEAAIGRLGEERDHIQSPDEKEEDALAEAAEKLIAANAVVHDQDEKLTALTEQAANDEARRAGLEHKLEDLKVRNERLAARNRALAEQRLQLESETPETSKLAQAEQHLEETRAQLAQARAALGEAETARAEAHTKALESVTGEQAATAAVTRLNAEALALGDVLGTGDDDQWPPVFDKLGVEAGFEKALAMALGDDLTASDNEAAPSHWRSLSPQLDAQGLPDGARPLSNFVEAPAALARRLLQIGVVDGEEQGNRLAGQLAQGQRLVSPEGGLWRWDGFTVAANTPTAAQARLEQRHRLNETREKLSEAEATAGIAKERLNGAQNAESQAIEAERTARDTLSAADEAFGEARDTVAGIKDRSAGQVSLLASLFEQTTAIMADQEHLETEQNDAVRALGEIPDPAGPRQEIATFREELAGHRSHQVECQSRHDTLVRAADERRQRLAAIDSEVTSWQARKVASSSRLQQLDERRQSLEAELARLKSRPEEIATQRNELLGALEKAEEARKKLADELALTEAALADADRALRTAEAELASARESMVRCEGAALQAKQSCHAIAERIKDRLECRPDQLFDISALKPDAELPDLEAIERKVERLNRERETMGPVNLRAEQEAEEMREQIDTLVAERDDLLKAIDKLRRGISELNREGRARLLASFEEVNQHFQELFVKLFGGGKAHLELTESDDPLDAGLEIMASPPGKRMQVLSLLSGGEQALTAIALLFGVFQTNPAPICVLDEVDAPLDDANVDRFCSMLESMAKRNDTRFLTITHHRMTMARMDRLYGVTMAERGVSQLVSVDLHRAEELRATA
ncbi:MAG: chromosome segregation protein SMC [Proteobacteria bacterium]|nr:chromosome segregation protein SMC [Pseudomonadota bacterium]MDA1022348.1 chromosome segregation protein SMC [Pseudomonadota bacterium]